MPKPTSKQIITFCILALLGTIIVAYVVICLIAMVVSIVIGDATAAGLSFAGLVLPVGIPVIIGDIKALL